MERNFKVGDKVRIRQWDDMAKEFGTDINGNINTDVVFVKAMKPLCGKKAKIGSIDNIRVRLKDFEECEELSTVCLYTLDMIKHIEEEKGMTKNKVINVLMKELGVEIGEEFNIEDGAYNPYHFDEKGNLVDVKNFLNGGALVQDLIYGKRTIRKILVKEMTIADIEKELGYKVKVVKG